MSSSALRRVSATRRPNGTLKSMRHGVSLKVLSEKNHKKDKKRGVLKIALGVFYLVSLILTPLLINTQLAVLSYQIHEDQVKLSKQQELNRLLENEISQQSSVERVRVLAKEQGLVPAGEVGSIHLQGKKIEGGKAAQPPKKEETAKEKRAGGDDAHTEKVQEH